MIFLKIFYSDTVIEKSFEHVWPTPARGKVDG